MLAAPEVPLVVLTVDPAAQTGRDMPDVFDARNRKRKLDRHILASARRHRDVDRRRHLIRNGHKRQRPSLRFENAIALGGIGNYQSEATLVKRRHAIDVFDVEDGGGLHDPRNYPNHATRPIDDPRTRTSRGQRSLP